MGISLGMAVIFTLGQLLLLGTLLAIIHRYGLFRLWSLAGVYAEASCVVVQLAWRAAEWEIRNQWAACVAAAKRGL